MVARETSIADGLSQLGIPASPAVVACLEGLAGLLRTEAVDLGYLGPDEGPRVVPRHILEAAALYPLVSRFGTDMVDVGSGAGLPGLVLCALGASVHLVEAQQRRARFLMSLIARLDLDGVVLAQRAEDVARGELREGASVVTARALASIPVALELCLPLVSMGGVCAILASPPVRHPVDALSSVSASGGGSDTDPLGTLAAGPTSGVAESPEDRPPAEGASDRRQLSREPGGSHGAAEAVEDTAGDRRAGGNNIDVVSAVLGGGPCRWIELAVPGASAARWVMMVRKVRPTPARFPRRSGVPKRRPLGGDVASVDYWGSWGR